MVVLLHHALYEDMLPSPSPIHRPPFSHFLPGKLGPTTSPQLNNLQMTTPSRTQLILLTMVPALVQVLIPMALRLVIQVMLGL